jgi:hypothetical protein
VSNLCRGKPPPSPSEVKEALPILATALGKVDDHETLSDAVWGLVYLVGDDPVKIDALFELNTVPHLVEFLNLSYASILIPTLRLIGNLLTGSSEQAESILEMDLLERYLALLGHEKDAIRREVCWGLSNLVSESKQCIGTLLNNSILIERLITMLNNEPVDVSNPAIGSLSH